MSQQLFTRALRTDLSSMSSQVIRWHKKGKVTEATVNARKEKKRLKDTNLFTGDYTGERPPHPWMTGKRLRSLVTAYQTFSNKNRLNVIIDKADKILMKQKFEEIGAHEYYQMRCNQIQAEKNEEGRRKVEAELEQMPFAINEELTNMPTDKRNGYASDIHNPFMMYFEQIARMFDEEHFTKLKVSQRLKRLADDKLGEND